VLVSKAEFDKAKSDGVLPRFSVTFSAAGMQWLRERKFDQWFERNRERLDPEGATKKGQKMSVERLTPSRFTAASETVRKNVRPATF
jgi:hypothetical protein